MVWAGSPTPIPHYHEDRDTRLILGSQSLGNFLVRLLRGARSPHAELHRRVLNLRLHGKMHENGPFRGQRFVNPRREVLQIVVGKNGGVPRAPRNFLPVADAIGAGNGAGRRSRHRRRC